MPVPSALAEQARPKLLNLSVSGTCFRSSLLKCIWFSAYIKVGFGKLQIIEFSYIIVSLNSSRRDFYITMVSVLL